MSAASIRFRALLALAVLALLSAGLWVSWHYTFGTWRADPDIFVTVQLWKGVREFGPGFVRTWVYTQDNWLLSLVPFTSLLFEAAGASTTNAVLPGWIIFVSSVAMTSWLTFRLAGVWPAIGLACVLIFGGAPALGTAGYLSYPISHNLSMAWVLLTLILSLEAFERKAVVPALAAAAAVFINTVSDPWAAAAIAAPLIVTSGAIAWLTRGTQVGRVAMALSLATTAALALAQTRVFGALSFLPTSHFQLADLATMRLNIGWAQRSLGHIFNIIPGGDLAATAPRLVAAGAVVAVIGLAIAATLMALPRASAGRQLIGAVSALSMLGVAALFVVSRFPPSLAVGRFLPQFYYLGGLLVALVAADHWARWPRAWRAGFVGYAGLFVLAGIFSAPDLWMRKERAAPYADAAALGQVLQSRGLHYGYGVFWGAHTLVMDTLTDGAVTIRPVSFATGNVRRRGAQTSSLWYQPAAEPQGDQRRFLIIANDGEECPDVEVCAQIAQRQFGPASERIEHSGRIILVWPEPIAPKIEVW